jgi:signal transduction histidine kinase
MSELPEELIIKNRNYHRITFADNGIGFDPQFTHKIFDVFKRLKPIDARGTGIGLAIVKKVALNHDGFVIAEGFPGEGAKFHVFLPMGRDSHP